MVISLYGASALAELFSLFLVATDVPLSGIPGSLIPFCILVGILFGIKTVFDQWIRDKQRQSRTNYYRDTYLKSDDWKRKRSVVLKRDSYKCASCGARASQVHHKKYARRNIGKEPIEWLVSLCDPCHRKQHGR